MKFNKISREAWESSSGFTSYYDDIKLPKRATAGSAGYDFYLPYDIYLAAGESLVIYTGINCKLDPNKVLMVYPRSGLGFKFKTRLSNTVGVIDSDYINSDNEGHIMIKLCNEGTNPLALDAGQAFAQGIISSFYVVDEENTDNMIKRNGGLGSTSNE